MEDFEAAIRELFADIGEEQLGGMRAALAKYQDLDISTTIELGRWGMTSSLACDMRVLFPGSDLYVREDVWDGLSRRLSAELESQDWASVSHTGYSLKMLFPERADRLGLDEHAFDAMNYIVPSVWDSSAVFLQRAVELMVLFPQMAGEIDLFDAMVERVLEQANALPPSEYMYYPWRIAHLRVLFPDAAPPLHAEHMESVIRDCRLAMLQGSWSAFPRFGAPLKLIAATEVRVTDRGLEAVMD
jgi:hypothetical protein